MSERALGGQSAFDQPMRRLGLANACIASTAGITGTDGDDHLEAGRDDVQPFRTVFADLHHIGAAAGADLLRRFNHLFDARQVTWQMAEVALGRRSPLGAVGIADGYCFPASFGLGDSHFQVLESQLTVIRVQLLGPFAIERVPQFGDPLPGSGLPSNHEREIILTLGLGTQARHFGLHCQKGLPHGRRKGIQIKGQRGER